MTSSGFGLFGTGTRTTVLLAISLLEETHVQELARVLSIGKTTVRNTIDTLEQSGIVAGVLEGRTRRIRLDSRFVAYSELKSLLEKMTFANPALLSAVSELRRRPRRIGKQL